MPVGIEPYRLLGKCVFPKIAVCANVRVADDTYQRASSTSNSSRARYNRLNSKRLLPVPDRVHTNFRPVGQSGAKTRCCPGNSEKQYGTFVRIELQRADE